MELEDVYMYKEHGLGVEREVSLFVVFQHVHLVLLYYACFFCIFCVFWKAGTQPDYVIGQSICYGI